MTATNYNFNQCKLCKSLAAEPGYDLGDAVIYVCKKCDFHFLNYLDGTSGLNSNAELSDKSYRYIEARLADGEQNHQLRLELVQKHVDLSAAKALDIGAGVGQFQLLMRGQGAETWGIEPSHLRRQYAEEKSALRLNPELVDDPYWQGGFKDHFDLITLWDVIEHVDFPAETLAAAVKLLKPDGMLLLDTPSRMTLPYRLSEFAYMACSKKMSLFLSTFYSTNRYGHKQIFTPLQLEGLFLSCGLKIITRTKSYQKKSNRGNRIILVGQKNNRN